MAEHNALAAAKHTVDQVSQQAVASPWFEQFARFGYAAKGVVYIVFGLLAARAAFGLGGQATDKTGVLRTILAQPFGKVLLALVAAGLIGYVLWRFVQALISPDQERTGAKGIFQRIGYGFSGLLYASLALSAIQLLLNLGGGGANGQQGWVARGLSAPFGRWLVGIAGLIVIGGGLYQLYKAYSAKFSEKFKWDQMSATERTWATRLGRCGLAARGLVQVIIGMFFVQAALLLDPGKAQGTNAALETLARSPLGPWAMGIVTIGLAAYGVYMLAAARYSRIVRN